MSNVVRNASCALRCVPFAPLPCMVQPVQPHSTRRVLSPAQLHVGACDASMSADAAPNTVFVRNLPFNVSDEQVRCRALRQASRG